MERCENDVCGLDKYKQVVQLHDKDKNSKEYPIFPVTYTHAVYDGKTGANLESMLAQFNNVFLQYQGTAKDTRLLLPKEMRRKGVQITYRNMDDEVVTEKCVNDSQSDNDHWGLDANWMRIDELSLQGDISVSKNGTWIINGVDTGVKALGPKGDNGLTPWMKTIDNKLYYSYDNQTWELASDYIAAWFRFTGTSGSSQVNNVGKIQISRDEGKTWVDLSGTFTNNLHIKGYVAMTSDLPSSAVQGDIYGVGPTYEESDTEHTNPIYKLFVKNENVWVDNGQFTSIAAGVVQELGESETEVVSQKVVSENINSLLTFYSSCVKSLEASDSLSGGCTDFVTGNMVDILSISTSELSLPIVDYDGNLGSSVPMLWATVQEGRYYHIVGDIETTVPMSIIAGWSSTPSDSTLVTNYNSWKPSGKQHIDIIVKSEAIRMSLAKGLTITRVTSNLITTKVQTRSAISHLVTPTVDMSTANRRGPNSLVPKGSTINSFSFIPKQAGTSLMEVWKLENGILTVIDSLDITAIDTSETQIEAYIGKTLLYDTLFTFVNKEGITGCVGMADSSTAASRMGQFSIPVSVGSEISFSDISSTFGALSARLIYTLPIDNDVKEVGNLGILEVGPYKQFNTIQSAVNTARDGDTILIYPGTYNERVQAWGKNINLIGISRETCVLQDDSSDYRTPPLEMNVGSVQNMTIIETASNPDPNIDGVILPEGWPAKNMAYTIHAESAVNSYGRSLKVIGCRLINANRPCIGAGTYNNYSIELIDTELYSGVGVYEEYKRGALYVHAKADGTGVSQSLKIIRCDVYCEDSLAVTLRGYSSNSVKNFDITALNCNVYSAINGKSDSIVDNNFGTESGMLLNDRSYGNNISVLNKL